MPDVASTTRKRFAVSRFVCPGCGDIIEVDGVTRVNIHTDMENWPLPGRVSMTSDDSLVHRCSDGAYLTSHGPHTATTGPQSPSSVTIARPPLATRIIDGLVSLDPRSQPPGGHRPYDGMERRDPEGPHTLDTPIVAPCRQCWEYQELDGTRIEVKDGQAWHRCRVCEQWFWVRRDDAVRLGAASLAQ
jgi:hypothetical protein